MKNYKNLLKRILSLVLICALVLPFAACGKDSQTQDPTDGPANTDPQAQKQTYTVKVESAGGMALSGVGVYIYEDETLAELVWFDQTGDDGTMTFTDVVRNTYVAVLADVPTGYAVREQYPITGETTVITLEQAQMDDITEDVVYKPGDLVMDFTVTDNNGNSYTLSELLKQKKAVVLNFWFIECEPCKAEFPFLQEAYDKYQDDIALLALTPINTADAVAAFQAENGYTFPMMACDSSWQKIFGVPAYPTTIIIDRFGNIALKHTGSIDSAKTFADAFAFFTAEDYTAQIVDDITSLEVEADQGTLENPLEFGGQSSFQVTVDSDKEVYTAVHKAKDMYLSIKGKNKNFYVLYNNKTYTPDSSNTVGFVVTTGDNYTPAVFAIGNEDAKAQSFQVNLGHLAGSFNNPYDLPIGEFTAQIYSGNEKGIYYRATTPEDGTFIVQCVSAPAGVEYDFSLQSLDENRTVLRNYRGEGTVDEATGYPTVTLEMAKGSKIMFSVGTLPDDANNYPGGTFRFLVTFQPGELKEEEKVEKIDYTVTVTGPEGIPMADVTVWLSQDTKTFSGKTDAEGKVVLNLDKGTYTGTLSLPEGYTLENNAFELTPEAPAAEIQLAAVVDTRVEYIITVTDPFEVPVEGAEVLVIGVGSALTDAEGKARFLLEPGSYTITAGALPAGFSCDKMLTTAIHVTEAALVLDYLAGTQQNPIAITEEDSAVTNAGTTWYATRFGGSNMTVTGAPGFTVTYADQQITAADGTVTLPVTVNSPFEPMVFAITGDGEYHVTFAYPAGHQMNPAALALGQNSAKRETGDTEYYYTWTAIADGKLTITMDKNAQWVYCLNNVTAGTFGETHWSDDETVVTSETIDVKAGDEISLTVNTYDPADMFVSPAGTVTFEAAFTWIVESIPFTTAKTPAGGSYNYEITGAADAIVTITSDTAWVRYNGTTYTAKAGKVELTLGKEDVALITVGNGGTEEAKYDVAFSWPVGHSRNPQIIACAPGVSTLSVKDIHADGFYAVMTSTVMGTVSLTVAPTEISYTLQLTRNNGKPQTFTPDSQLDIYVYPGDTLSILLTAAPADFALTWEITDDNAQQTVTFDACGGVLTGAATALTNKGRLEALPTDPTREGYTFAGWFDAAEGGNRVSVDTIYEQDTTVYAQWVKIEYKVTFDACGGTMTGEATLTTVDYKLAALPAVTRKGYTFNGWFDAAEGGNAVTVDTVYSANTTIYAQWTQVERQVTFDACGGTLEGEAAVMTEDGKLIVLPAVTRENYIFNGWFDAAEGGNAITLDTVYSADTTIYAQWTRIEYQVTFDACGGTLEGEAAVMTEDGKLAALPTAVLEGYEFAGWFDAAEGGNAITLDTVYSANTTIYAQWIYVAPQPMDYTVTVLDSDGQPVPSGVVVTWQGENGTATKAITTADGTVTAQLLPGSYQIILTLTGTWAEYKYTSVTVTESAPAATLELTPPTVSEIVLEQTYVGNFLQVGLGKTFVTLNSSQPNYAVYEGTAYCFFYCPITEEGVYELTTTNGAPISNWGTNSFFLNKQELPENNVITETIKEANLHDGMAIYFAVEVTAANESTILQLKNTGKAEVTYLDAPYIIFKGTMTPEIKMVGGKPTAIEENIFKLDLGGKELTYVDMLNDKPVLGADGYYHLGTEDGPILYVNLGGAAPHYSMATLVGVIGQFGTSLRKTFLDENKNPIPTGDPEFPFQKEDYTEAMTAYCLHADKATGLYPLTEDLAYMLYHGGEAKEWYDPTNPNYLFAETEREVDPALLWMFAVCYLK